MESIVVIDDFYGNPDGVRRLALSLPYAALPTFTKLYQSDRSLVSTQVVKTLGEAVGRKDIKYDKNNRTFGVFRAAMLVDTDQTNIHTDLHDWAALIHLSPNPPPGTGTGFFRHRSTGLIGPPPGFAEHDPMMTNIYAEGGNPAAWEMYRFIESRFNRLVIFNGRDLFHDAIGRFGIDLVTCRLTQNFFFSQD